MKKGDATRTAILDRATELARTVGLEGLSIGRLADELALSKSGLFAHFGSKDALHLAVVEHARVEFVADVIAPALRAARGEPRLRAMYDRWCAWGARDGGCVFVALAAELDDRPGPARDALAAALRDWLDAIATAARIAIDEGHLAAGCDPQQLAFELYGIMLAHHDVGRLIRDPKAALRSKRAFDALLARCR
ncbi:MAG: TetR/AcrR family transcriptional regulator [Myxococcales bacterium]|nr:TetR/AcrR family transcriptional regulator [Myxococcales bacterium]